jgi:uncharacterized DUF497 family protein
VRFEWDEAKAAENLRKHGISFPEASTVFADPLSWTYPDPDHSDREERYLTIGLSARRAVVIIGHADEGDTVRIITARRATNHERGFYEAQR